MVRFIIGGKCSRGVSYCGIITAGNRNKLSQEKSAREWCDAIIIYTVNTKYETQNIKFIIQDTKSEVGKHKIWNLKKWDELLQRNQPKSDVMPS